MITCRSLRRGRSFGKSLVTCYVFLKKRLIFLVAFNGLLLEGKAGAKSWGCFLEFFIGKSLG